MRRLSRALLLLVPTLLPVVAAACGTPSMAQAALKMAPESSVPYFAEQAPPEVRDAYRFALANPDVLQYIPCYCGCGGSGHRSNYDCYIQEVRPDGTVSFSQHAFT